MVSQESRKRLATTLAMPEVQSSIWVANAGLNDLPTEASYPKAQSGKHYDVVVVGGGIFGCATAVRAGRSTFAIARRSLT